MPIHRIRSIYWMYRSRSSSFVVAIAAGSLCASAAIATEEDPMPEEKKKIMTTDAGRPVGDNQNSLTVGPRGPVVFEDFLLFEKMAHFNRERIPERVVHAKGSGAYGYFVCTNPLTTYTTAKLFSSKGKK